MAATTRTLSARLALLLAALSWLQPALAEYWTVTYYYVDSYSYWEPSRCTQTTSSIDRDDCTSTYTYTSSRPVNPSVTPSGTPYSTYRYTPYYDDVVYVTAYYSMGAVAESDLEPTSTSRISGLYTYTRFVYPVEYTAPSSCPTPFTFTTQTVTYLPDGVENLVSPTATSTSQTVYSYRTGSSTDVYITYYLDPSELPAPTSTRTTSDYYERNYIASCINPAEYFGGGSSGGGSSGGGSSGGGSSSSLDACYLYGYGYACPMSIPVWAVVLAVLLPLLFIIGAIESWFYFRRLFLGQKTLRLGTVSWSILFLPLLLLTRIEKARTPEHQAILRRHWETLPGSERFKLWFKWGFRWNYPTELLGSHDGSIPPPNVPVPEVAAPQYAGFGAAGYGYAKPGDAASGISGVSGGSGMPPQQQYVQLPFAPVPGSYLMPTAPGMVPLVFNGQTFVPAPDFVPPQMQQAGVPVPGMAPPSTVSGGEIPREVSPMTVQETTVQEGPVQGTNEVPAQAPQVPASVAQAPEKPQQ